MVEKSKKELNEEEKKALAKAKKARVHGRFDVRATAARPSRHATDPFDDEEPSRNFRRNFTPEKSSKLHLYVAGHSNAECRILSPASSPSGQLVRVWPRLMGGFGHCEPASPDQPSDWPTLRRVDSPGVPVMTPPTRDKCASRSAICREFIKILA
jgi:hypothetical protein